MTERNIEYNLKISPYQHEVWYGNESIIFCFSSKTYKEKFISTYTDERQILSVRLANLLRYNIDIPILYDISTYKRIEKRGFYIKWDGVEYEGIRGFCLNGNLELNII